MKKTVHGGWGKTDKSFCDNISCPNIAFRVPINNNASNKYRERNSLDRL